MATSNGVVMTKDFFVKAGLEDGIPATALEVLWEQRPDIIDLIPENDLTRKELKDTNVEMKESMIELAAMVAGNAGKASA